MDMQLVIGGAFSGKRKLVKERNRPYSWVSAYEGDQLSDWETKWLDDTTLVLEGWEKWISSELMVSDSNDEIRHRFKALFQVLLEEEKKRNHKLVLVMLEVGKGIVPLHKEDRRLRDLAGWIAQDAAKLSDEVHFVWNGLSKRLR
jgi:adenosylcobinamide kinase / adenosylcobinamide-phosphate guanylyltransferase